MESHRRRFLVLEGITKDLERFHSFSSNVQIARGRWRVRWVTNPQSSLSSEIAKTFGFRDWRQPSQVGKSAIATLYHSGNGELLAVCVRGRPNFSRLIALF
jgi:hypothetical protein